MIATTFRALVALALLSVSKAQAPTPDNLIPIFSDPQAQRAALNNALFFDPDALPVVNLPGGVTLQAGSVANALSLALPDVQFAFAQGMIPPHADFPTHTHPGATAFQLNVEGILKITIYQEGTALEPIVFNTKPGQFASIPRGLPHTTRCISDKPCRFTSTFNSPSPRIVFVTPGLPEASPEETAVTSPESE
eukprot:Plantae.Rhodophyta-Hildenbrandia_rubra.ctg22231.p1 GENE.Plantae.Rhodophyta-Hildenbrandia_rubra.ctg22231~~Plantae.Rhodophyta-Hildenbrandia_rubra.ctg22231.p1  ORF type:complete len:193 (+),score=16.44 Plantae.Rhodophyta-Hildenbrandia_rubra.ctg22231:2242-2820(+)